jgi:4a-hydroxytetrahydrobiopterin dehydratase
MKQVPQWTLAEDACSIERTFTFNGFQGAMFAVNGVAALAEKEGHHPDLHIAFNTVRISISTHAIGGLSENDFILAAKIDELMQ